MNLQMSSLLKTITLGSAVFAFGLIGAAASKNEDSAKPKQLATNTTTGGQVVPTLFIDLAKVFNESKQAQADTKNLTNAEQKADAELKALYDAGAKMMEELQELNEKAGLIPAGVSADGKPIATNVYSDEAKEGFKKDIASISVKIGEKEKEYLQLREQYQRTLDAQRQQYMMNFENAVQVASEAIRKERGAAFILNTSGPIVIAYDPAADVTDELLKRLNANFNTDAKPDSAGSASSKSSK